MAVKPHLEEDIVAALRRILRAIAMHSHRLQEECGLTGPQLLALRVIAQADELTVSALARNVALSQSTTSELLRRLARQGLVEMRVGADRRSKVARVTPEGEKRAASAPSLLQERFHAELEKREEYEQTLILATLQQIASMMDAEDLEAAPFLSVTPGPLDPGKRE
ncbi:MAG: MarR family winged helix-turn-helix transcriptional regulator [Myxococcota bacterium]